MPEGVEGMVKVKGSVTDILHYLIGGLRASMGYCGAKDLKTFSTDAKFIKVSKAAVIESHPHNIMNIKNAPNYEKLK